MSLISINGQTIRRNATKGETNPPVRIARTRTGGAVGYANDVAILDREGQEVARLVYTPDGAILKCGARMVLETVHDVRVIS